MRPIRKYLKFGRASYSPPNGVRLSSQPSQGDRLQRRLVPWTDPYLIFMFSGAPKAHAVSYENTAGVGVFFPFWNISPSSHPLILVLSFHTLMNCKFRNSFLLTFIHWMEGVRVCVGTEFLAVATTT